MGALIASGFFGVGLMIIVFTNKELFTSNNMYLAVSSVEGRTSWRQAGFLWIAFPCRLAPEVGRWSSVKVL
jgi:nitrite transporter